MTLIEGLSNLAKYIWGKIMFAWMDKRTALARAWDRVARLELELVGARAEAEALRASLALALDLATAYRDQAGAFQRLQ